MNSGFSQHQFWVHSVTMEVNPASSVFHKGTDLIASKALFTTRSPQCCTKGSLYQQKLHHRLLWLRQGVTIGGTRVRGQAPRFHYWTVWFPVCPQNFPVVSCYSLIGYWYWNWTFWFWSNPFMQDCTYCPFNLLISKIWTGSILNIKTGENLFLQKIC